MLRHTGVETETKIKRTIAAKQKKNYIISEMGIEVSYNRDIGTMLKEVFRIGKVRVA
jgi:hypothetical protein